MYPFAMVEGGGRKARALDWAARIGLFVLAFLPRAIEPVSSVNTWYKRGIAFYKALERLDFQSTYQQHHPGVTTMWLAGGGMKLRALWAGASWHDLSSGAIDGTPAAVAAMAFVISLCIVVMAVCLARLTDPATGLVAGLLLALDPGFLAYSKVIYIEGLLMAFLSVAVLYLLQYPPRKSLRTLTMAGLFIALSLLTKTPAVMLCPFAALVIMYAHAWDDGSRLARARSIVQRGAFLIAVIAAAVYALFPALWMHADYVAHALSRHIAKSMQEPHRSLNFWWGETTRQDPGLPFYLGILAFRSTFITLPLSLFTTGLGLVELKRRTLPYRHVLWGLALFAVLFIVQMGLGAKKTPRYVYPVLPLMDMLAAIGLMTVARMCARWCRQGLRFLPAAGVAGLIALQAVLVLRYHPYYGLNANLLLGGPQVAQRFLTLQEQAEGVDRAARFINSHSPDPENAIVLINGKAGMTLSRFLRGKVGRGALKSQADYRIYYLDALMRPQRGWGKTTFRRLWDHDKTRDPLFRFTLDGIDYAWVYPRTTDDPKIKWPSGGGRRKRAVSRSNRRTRMETSPAERLVGATGPHATEAPTATTAR
jgi:hypothetical protein